MNNLKEYRKVMSLTQEQVADVIGCSRETYIRYETRDELPPLGVADALARFFHVTIYQVWPNLQSTLDYNFEIKKSYLDGRDSTLDALLSQTA